MKLSRNLKINKISIWSVFLHNLLKIWTNIKKLYKVKIVLKMSILKVVNSVVVMQWLYIMPTKKMKLLNSLKRLKKNE